MTLSNIFFFGYGYVAQHLHQMLPTTTKVAGCTRSELSKDFLYSFETIPTEILDQFNHFLISIPPNKLGDIVLQSYTDYFSTRLSTSNQLKILYLSATNVYGNQQDKWIDETTPPIPLTPRGSHRLLAEQQWQTTHLPLTIFRLSGIYGPGRSAIDNIISNKAHLVTKPGHLFNRMHVTDICRVILESLDKSHLILNLADDCPASLDEVYQYAFELLELPQPSFIDWQDADISEKMQTFLSERKYIRNDLIKQILKDNLLYPSYRDGLKDCLKWYRNQQKKLT